MRRHLTVVAVALLALLAGAAAAYAAIPGPDGTITTCFRADGIGQGQLSVIDSEETCPTGFETLTWSQSGTSGYELVSDTETAPDTTTTSIAASVSCTAGKVPVGGGASGSGGGGLTQSRPTTSGWQAAAQKFDPGNGQILSITTWAICVEGES